MSTIDFVSEIEKRIVDLYTDLGATVLTMFMVNPINKLQLKVVIKGKIWQVISHAMSGVFWKRDSVG